MIRRAGKLPGLVVACLLLSVASQAREYFVATDGADGNSGSQSRPFRTIQKAADLMWPGDTCYVRGGVYRQVVSPKRSGTPGKSEARDQFSPPSEVR